MSLYRKYRPLKLEDVVGEEQVTKNLANSLAQGKISHAYLFTGPRGTGKTSVARIFAHEINNFSYEVEDDYVDIIEIDGASNRGIDNIRELREKAAIAPTSGKYKVYIIDEVHMLTKEAFNALLKTLEEPPAHVIFIMATTDAYKVPVTITSRAQTFTFKLADKKVMFDFLKKVAEKEKIKIDDEALSIIVKRGGGSFRDSLSLLDQISTLSSDGITKDLVISAMGLPEDEKITELLEYYISGEIKKITESLKELLSSGVKVETLAEEIIGRIIEDPQPGLMQLLSKLPEVKAPFAEAKLLVALTENVSPNIVTLAPVKQELVKPEVKPEIKPINVNFDWNNFLDTVQKMNDAIFSQLKQAEYTVRGDLLEIYPARKISKTILSRENNKRILIEAANGMKITVCDKDEQPNPVAKDKLLSKISDIMGGEVQNDGGNSPF